MKQCPRCKSALNNSHNGKLTCKVCGFVTRHIEVVADNQQFQQRHHFGTRVRVNKQKEEQSAQKEQLSEIYILNFQSLISNAAKQLSEFQPKLKGVEKQCRLIWFEYLKTASRGRVRIMGVFSKLIRKRKKKLQLKNQEIKEEVKLNEQNEGVPHEEEKFNRAQECNIELLEVKLPVLPEQPKKRTRKSKCLEGQSTHEEKRVSFRLQAKKKFLSLRKFTNSEIEQKRKEFLQFLYYSTDSEIGKTDIEYVSSKYASFIVQMQRQQLNCKAGLKQSSIKIGIKQLRQLMLQRKLNFANRNEMLTILLLSDLLQMWASENSQGSDCNFKGLYSHLEAYQNSHNKKWIIQKVIAEMVVLTEKEGQQVEDEKKEELIPQLSMTLAYAILYLSCLRNNSAMGIADIIAACGKMQLQIQQNAFAVDERVTIFKIRRTAALLFRFLNSESTSRANNLKKWLSLEAERCGLECFHLEICKLGEVLYTHHARNEAKMISSIYPRYDYLEQDIIAKAIIVIFAKLNVDFGGYPYLSSFPEELIHIAPPQYQPILREALKLKGNTVNMIKVINKLESHYQEQHSRIQMNLPLSSYRSLNGLSTVELIEKMKVKVSNHQSCTRVQPRETQQILFSLIKSEPPKLSKLSTRFKRQVELMREKQQSEEFNFQDFDVPSCNYEFMYEYMSNIKHVHREMFAYFAETLVSGECRMKEFYQWLERMEKVLIEFEN